MKSRTKCTIVEATGVETIRYEDDDGQEREFDVDYKIYDRKAFTVYEDTSFYDYNGDLEFNEDESCAAQIELNVLGLVNLVFVSRLKSMNYGC